VASPPRVRIGVVARPHGVRGELKLALDNHESALLEPGLALTLVPRTGPARDVTIVDVKGGAVVRVVGVESREAADALRGAVVEIARDALPPLDDGEAYLVDLLGAALVDEGGRTLGTIESFTDNGAQALACVRTTSGIVEMPFVDALLVEVDAAARRVVARPPGGLFTDDAIVARDERKR
jgi:16S rRNA processing protein RimM